MSSGEGSESFPKEFLKTTEVLPFTKYGISTFAEFKTAEKDLHQIEWLKGAGLTNEEIQMYHDNEEGKQDKYTKLESSVLKHKIHNVYDKIDKFKQKEANQLDPVIADQNQPSTSKADNIFHRIENKATTFYPPGHPMNDIKQIEKRIFRHLDEPIINTTKRRKILRRLERRKERLTLKQELIPAIPTVSKKQPGSLWNVKEKDKIHYKETTSKEIYKLERPSTSTKKEKLIGPKKQTMYTIKDNKIVRLEPTANDDFRAVDIVVPINQAEEQLLEGTKMSIDDIRKIERFKDYDPGAPSKVLYVKNIAPTVSQQQLSLLFNQFVLENRRPIDIKLMSGRMRGQAFVAFQSETLSLQALEEVNGTILGGRPIIAQFGRNTNRIQDDNR